MYQLGELRSKPKNIQQKVQSQIRRSFRFALRTHPNETNTRQGHRQITSPRPSLKLEQNTALMGAWYGVVSSICIRLCAGEKRLRGFWHFLASDQWGARSGKTARCVNRKTCASHISSCLQRDINKRLPQECATILVGRSAAFVRRKGRYVWWPFWPMCFTYRRFCSRIVSVSGGHPQAGHAPPKLAAICQQGKQTWHKKWNIHVHVHWEQRTQAHKAR